MATAQETRVKCGNDYNIHALLEALVGYTPNTGRFRYEVYGISGSKKDWTAARADCLSRGGDLASITS